MSDEHGTEPTSAEDPTPADVPPAPGAPADGPPAEPIEPDPSLAGPVSSVVEAQPAPTDPGPGVDPALVAAVREIELHVAELGWDRPPALYALVPTADLLEREPELAEALGIESAGTSLTPVEQETLEESTSIEDTLEQILWPEEVSGCAVVLERLILPPSAEGQLPEDSSAARDFAAEHPERQEVRIVAAALRSGATFCSLRMRAHDNPLGVVESPDLVPTLLELVAGTLDEHRQDGQDT